MTETQWYASDEHFQTEESFEEYKRRKNKSGLETPTFKELMES